MHSGIEFSKHRTGLLVCNYRQDEVYLFDTERYAPSELDGVTMSTAKVPVSRDRR